MYINFAFAVIRIQKDQRAICKGRKNMKQDYVQIPALLLTELCELGQIT